MGSIYAGAWLTIVALAGDCANSGLPRVSPDVPRQAQIVCEVDGTKIVSVMPTLKQQLAGSTWNKRAWTLQERQLSARCLYFTAHQVHFECFAGQRCESVDNCIGPLHMWSNKHRFLATYDHSPQKMPRAGIFLDTIASFSTKTECTENTALSLYDGYIRALLCRSLTYEADMVNAAAGLLEQLRRLSPLLRSGFFWGLPVDILPWAMLWYSPNPCERRDGFPSWGWSGWRTSELKRIILDIKDIPYYPRNLARMQAFTSTNDTSSIALGRVQGGKAVPIYHESFAYDGELPYCRNYSRCLNNYISNSGYMQFVGYGETTPTAVDCRTLLLIQTVVFRAVLSNFSFQIHPKQPAEEHCYEVDIDGVTCRLFCYSEHIFQLLSTNRGGENYLAVLHREFEDWHWYFDLLLLEWRPDIAYRIAPVKLVVHMDSRSRVYKALNPAMGKFALG
jgi:hypothetical protein